MLHYTALTGWSFLAGAFAILALIGVPPRSAGPWSARLRQVILDPTMILIVGMALFGLFAVGVDLAASLTDPLGLGVIGAEGAIALILSGLMVRMALRTTR